MLFAYNDDGRLEVLADEATARTSFEPTDVDAGVIRFFDERGRPLTARFPNRREKKVLGIVVSSDPGPFHLEPSSTEDDETLLEALGPTVVLMKNQWFDSVDTVRTHLRGQA